MNQITLRVVVGASLFIAFFLLARFIFIPRATETGEAFFRVYSTIYAFAIGGACYAFLFTRHQSLSTRRRLIRAGIGGAVAGGIVALILGIEIANDVRLQAPEYWSWSRDYLEFTRIIGGITITSFVVGAIIGSVWIGCEWCIDQDRAERRSGTHAP